MRAQKKHAIRGGALAFYADPPPFFRFHSPWVLEFGDAKNNTLHDDAQAFYAEPIFLLGFSLAGD